MSSITSALSSSASTSSFNGMSQYASDLQQAINRAVSIAALPLTQLESEQSTLDSQSTELSTLSNDFNSLQTALDNIQSATGASSYVAGSSDDSVATATVSGATLNGSYSINVQSIGSNTVTMSANGLPTVTDPSSGSISSASSFTLTVDGTNYSVTPQSNSLSDLAAAINSAGANVQAVVVNVGSNSSPDYRLSVQGDTYAATSVQLNDGSNDLLNTLSTGSAVTYTVNGNSGTPVSSDSRSITLAPGLTANILGAGSATINVSQSTSSVSSALSAFVTAYNTALAEVTSNRGQSNGALNGNAIINTLGSTLRSIGGYDQGGSSMPSLSALGITFDNTGKLSFSQSAFDQSTGDAMSKVESFLGSETTVGFLKFAQDALASVTDSTNGSIQLAINSVTQQISDQNDRINGEEQRISQLQNSLNAQMSAADAAIYALQQQVTYFTGLFAAMKADNPNSSSNG